MSQSSQPLATADAAVGSVPVTAAHGKSVNRQIFRALLSLASAVLLVRLAGMLNQIVISAYFGAGATMDAYVVASTLPMLIGNLIVGAAQDSVIPVYARVRMQKTKEQAALFFSTMLNLLLVSGVLLTLVTVLFRYQLILFSAPAIDPIRRTLAVELSPLIFPVILLMSVNGFLECILNTEGQFGWPAYAGVLIPLATALIVLAGGKSQGVAILCIGVLVGQCVQLCVMVARARLAGLVYRPVIQLRNPALGLVMLAFWPQIFNGLIGQGSPLIDQIFASSLSAGNISALSYALKIVSVFTGVIFGSTGRALLPHLSRQVGEKDMRSYKETLRLYLWLITIGVTLMSAFVLVLAQPIVRILFQHGAFTSENATLTAHILVGFTVGLTPMALGFILSRAFAALGKNHLLLYVTIFSVFANAIFDYVFARFWQGMGIALSTSAVYFCTMIILLIMLRRVSGKLHLLTPPQEIRAVVLKVAGALSPRHYYQQRIGFRAYQRMLRIGFSVLVFAIGAIGIFLDPFYTLRIALGSVVVLLLLRYRFVLVLAWVTVIILTGFIASLAGNNLLTGLLAPTLLLMTCMPLKQTFKRMPALALLLVYLLWVFTSIGISAIGVGAFLTHWIIYLGYGGLGVLVINVITTRRRMLWLIDIMLLMAALVALYGIYGYFTKQNGVISPDIGFRITSIFQSAPSLALFLSLTIPCAFFRVLVTNGRMRIAYVLLIPVLLVALTLSFTRSAFISVPLSLLAMLLLLPSRRMKRGLTAGFAAVAILIVLVGAVTNLPILGRFFGQDLATLNGRTYLWQALLDHFDPTQLVGNGLNASDVLLTNLQVSANGRGVIATAPHSLFLGILYDHGIIGAVLLSVIFIVLFASLVAGVRKARGEHRILLAAALATFINLFVQSLTSSDFWIEAFSIYFWAIMALPFAAYWRPLAPAPDDDDDEATEPRIPALPRAQRGPAPRIDAGAIDEGGTL